MCEPPVTGDAARRAFHSRTAGKHLSHFLIFKPKLRIPA